MKTLNDYLDLTKAITGSDYKTAKALKITPTAISNARKTGSINNDNAVELAKILNVNPSEIIRVCYVSRHPENATFWGKSVGGNGMKALTELLDQAKTITGSDYATAERLDVRRQYISDARKGKGFSNEQARKLAEILGISVMEVIAAAETAKHPEKREQWEKWVASVAIVSFSLLLFSSDKLMAYEPESALPLIHYAHYS